MKYYKDYQKKWIGESDIASVIAGKSPKRPALHKH